MERSPWGTCGWFCSAVSSLFLLPSFIGSFNMASPFSASRHNLNFAYELWGMSMSNCINGNHKREKRNPKPFLGWRLSKCFILVSFSEQLIIMFLSLFLFFLQSQMKTPWRDTTPSLRKGFSRPARRSSWKSIHSIQVFTYFTWGNDWCPVYEIKVK